MADVDFSDGASAKAWFEGQSIEMRCAMTSRAACRVVANICPDGENAAPDLALPVLRAILTSAGRGLASPADVSAFDWDQAARSASAAAYSAVSAALSAPLSANSAARSAADSARSALSAANSALSADTRTSLEDLYRQPVWGAVEVPAAIVDNVATFRTFLAADPAWGFWLRFFDGMWNGTFDEWDLAIEVIKIDEEDWEKGYAHIGGVIAGIEADLINQRSTLAENLYFNEESARGLPTLETYGLAGQFDVEPVKVSAPDALERAVSKVEDSFSDAMTLGHGQHVRETTLEGLILSRVFAKYRTDPHRVEMDFEDVRRVLVANICNDENPNRNYPRCDELDLLVSAINSACGEIRAAYPEIAQARAEMDAADQIAPISAEDKEIWLSATPVLRAISDERLDRGWVEDIGELVNDAITDVPTTAPRLPAAGERIVAPRKSVVRRLAYRISSIRLKLGRMIKKVDDSAAAKLGGLITVIGGLIQLLMQML